MSNDTKTLQWSDAMLLGHGPIDATHKEFVIVVTELQQCTDATAVACLAALEQHLDSHFSMELELMDSTAFPNRNCHMDEHQKVSDAVHQVHELAIVGEVSLEEIKSLAQALVDWFPGHAEYMDSALSAWVSKQMYGGKPVVLRRNLTPDESRVPNQQAA
ncbi:bacteriohemerythrin [Paraburkholderia sp. BR14374]|uniref:bacteriohemerythrin n=1 Tax=Paraburkholderia sp. BR14374 TaxID=3237007 RepID=UPI0034CFA3FC